MFQKKKVGPKVPSMATIAYAQHAQHARIYLHHKEDEGMREEDKSAVSCVFGIGGDIQGGAE